MNKNDDIIDDIKTQLYELYIDMKTFLISSEKEKENNETKQEISSSSEPDIIIKYLKNCIKILIDEKNNDNKNKEQNNITNGVPNNDIINQFESYIKKLEMDIKYNIKKQFIYKIQKDSLEMKIRGYMEIEEEYEELKEKVKYENGKFLENDRKDNEIVILRRENSNLKKEINKIEEKNKNYEKKHNEDQDVIKGLKSKISKLEEKIEEMKEKINEIKNKNSNNLNIHKNIVEHYNMTTDKNSIDNKVNINIKHGLTNYQSNSYINDFESNKNNQIKIKTLHTNTIDNNNNKLSISYLNKLYNKNKNINPHLINNNKNRNKHKSNSVSMRSDENEKSELLTKYLSANQNNKYGPYTKIRSLNKFNNKMNGPNGYKLPKAHSNFNIKYIKREDKNPYEYSALNFVGIKGTGMTALVEILFHKFNKLFFVGEMNRFNIFRLDIFCQIT